MDFNATIDLIIRELDEAREIIDDLRKYPGVPVIQVELAKSKCRNAGEIIALLKNVQISAQVEEKVVQPVAEPVKKEIPVKKEMPVKKETSFPKPEVSLQAAVIQKETGITKETRSFESTIIADSFSHLSSRFNEQLGNLKAEEDISEIMKTKPVTSLTEAIGINDRFFYIREVFNGNKEAYNQAISRLDNTESMTDAKAVIMSFTGDNNENEAVRQLLDLVKRKLPSNE